MSLTIKCLCLCVKLQAQFHVDVSFVTASNTFVSTTVNQRGVKAPPVKGVAADSQCCLNHYFLFFHEKRQLGNSLSPKTTNE